MIKIELIKTKKQVREFVNFPLKLYKNCPFYVPQFYRDELKVFNPKNRDTQKYYMEAFLARDESSGKVVGRIAALIHKQYNKLYNDKRVRFTRFDLIDNDEVANVLLGEAEAFALRHGMHTVCGPMGAIDQDREGLLTEGFNLISTFALNYNFPYYKTHVERLGYTQETVWNEKQFDIAGVDSARFQRLADIVLKRHNFHELKIKSTKEAMSKYRYQVFDLVNETYGSLYGYVPLTHDDVDRLVKQFGIALRKEYISVVLNSKEEIIAFALSMPSIAQAVHNGRGKYTPLAVLRLLYAIKHPKVLECLLICVKKEYRTSGVAAVVMNRLLQNARKQGIVYTESNAQLLDNQEIQSIYENFNPRVVRFRAAYVKSLK